MDKQEQARGIMQLFDLPGVEDPGGGDESPARIGRDAKESRAFGDLSMKAQRYAEAIEHFKRAVAQGDEGAVMDLAGAYETADMLPQAYIQYRKAQKSHAGGELAIALAGLYRKYGRLNDAVEELRAGVEREPENAYLHFRLADALRQAGFRSAAWDALQGALANAPDDAFYQYWAADLALERGDFEQAVANGQAAIELSPGDDHLLRVIAAALWGAGKRVEAVRAARLACDLGAGDLANRVLLEALLRADGQIEAAEAESELIARADEYDASRAWTLLVRAGLERRVG